MNRSRCFKVSCNVIKEYVSFISKNYVDYVKLVMGKYYDKELFYKYLDTYINVRYYHNELDIKSSFETTINYYLNDIYEKNNSKTSKFIFELFKMFYYIDNVREFRFKDDFKKYVDELCSIRVEKLRLDDSDFKGKFISLVKENDKRKKKYLSSFDTKDFNLGMEKIIGRNIYDIELSYTIEIPSIFSEKAVSKVYNESLVAENKLYIEYYLVNKYLLEDIISCNFDREYLVEFNFNLFNKKDKLKRLFNIMDNDIARENIIIKICYEEFLKYKDFVYYYIKLGYQFGLIIDDTYIEKPMDVSGLIIFKYVIILDKKYEISFLLDKPNVLIIK